MTFILHTPGYRSREILVSATYGEVQVAALGLPFCRQLPPDADPSTAGWRYNNGILSVRIKKFL